MRANRRSRARPDEHRLTIRHPLVVPMPPLLGRRQLSPLRPFAAGFTFMEAITAMLIASVLVAVAVPAMADARSVAHAKAARAALLESITQSIAHSALTGSEVVLCASGDGIACSGQPEWSGGWLAYADLDGNRERTDGETLLRRQQALDGGVHLRSTAGRTRLIFRPNGGNVGSNVTFTLCDRRGPDKAVTLVMANNGRLRDGTPTATAARDCADER